LTPAAVSPIVPTAGTPAAAAAPSGLSGFLSNTPIGQIIENPSDPMNWVNAGRSALGGRGQGGGGTPPPPASPLAMPLQPQGYPQGFAPVSMPGGPMLFELPQDPSTAMALFGRFQ